MIRQVDLVSYLPTFMSEYKEVKATLEAENPEFYLAWESTDKVLRNEFIATADESGIERYEKMLGILPFLEDTLESRRERVQNRWMDSVPYTFRTLLQRITMICADTDFILESNFKVGYTLMLKTNLEGYGKVREIESILNRMLPCNITVMSENTILPNTVGKPYFGGITSIWECITIST